MINQHRSRTSRSLVAILSFGALSACAPGQPLVPPLTPAPSNHSQTGQFVWYDLLTNNPDGAKHFYGELFGWTFDDGGEETPVFTTILHNGRPIGGLIDIRETQRDFNASQWVSNLSVPDVDRAVEDVVRLGGTLDREPLDLPHRGRLAVVRDNQNAMFALLNSPTGDPP